MKHGTHLLWGLTLVAFSAAAHHSFAIYDMDNEFEFEGIVETLKFRNPHIAMTLRVTEGDGSVRIVDFVEGAPANMLVRRGLKPAMIQPGSALKAIGAPRFDNGEAYFLKELILSDGTRFQILE